MDSLSSVPPLRQKATFVGVDVPERSVVFVLVVELDTDMDEDVVASEVEGTSVEGTSVEGKTVDGRVGGIVVGIDVHTGSPYSFWHVSVVESHAFAHGSYNVRVDAT